MQNFLVYKNYNVNINQKITLGIKISNCGLKVLSLKAYLPKNIN